MCLRNNRRLFVHFPKMRSIVLQKRRASRFKFLFRILLENPHKQCTECSVMTASIWKTLLHKVALRRALLGKIAVTSTGLLECLRPWLYVKPLSIQTIYICDAKTRSKNSQRPWTPSILSLGNCHSKKDRSLKTYRQTKRALNFFAYRGGIFAMLTTGLTLFFRISQG